MWLTLTFSSSISKVYLIFLQILTGTYETKIHADIAPLGSCGTDKNKP